jgi:hypothetical protein
VLAEVGLTDDLYPRHRTHIEAGLTHGEYAKVREPTGLAVGDRQHWRDGCMRPARATGLASRSSPLRGLARQRGGTWKAEIGVTSASGLRRRRVVRQYIPLPLARAVFRARGLSKLGRGPARVRRRARPRRAPRSDQHDRGARRHDLRCPPLAEYLPVLVHYVLESPATRATEPDDVANPLHATQHTDHEFIASPLQQLQRRRIVAWFRSRRLVGTLGVVPAALCTRGPAAREGRHP